MPIIVIQAEISAVYMELFSLFDNPSSDMNKIIKVFPLKLDFIPMVQCVKISYHKKKLYS